MVMDLEETIHMASPFDEADRVSLSSSSRILPVSIVRSCCFCLRIAGCEVLGDRSRVYQGFHDARFRGGAASTGLPSLLTVVSLFPAIGLASSQQISVVVQISLTRCCVCFCRYLKRFLTRCGFSLTSANFRPVWLVSLLLATKMCDDRGLYNEDFAWMFPNLCTCRVVRAQASATWHAQPDQPLS